MLTSQKKSSEPGHSLGIVFVKSTYPVTVNKTTAINVDITKKIKLEHYTFITEIQRRYDDAQLNDLK